VGPIFVLEEMGDLAGIPILLRIAQDGGGFPGSSIDDVPFLMKVVQGVPLLHIEVLVFVSMKGHGGAGAVW
jgi:hypothetical protein